MISSSSSKTSFFSIFFFFLPVCMTAEATFDVDNESREILHSLAFIDF